MSNLGKQILRNLNKQANTSSRQRRPHNEPPRHQRRAHSEPTRHQRRHDNPPHHHRHHEDHGHHHTHHHSGKRKGSCFSSIAALIIMLVLVFLVVYKEEVKEKLFPEDTITTEDTGTVSNTAVTDNQSDFKFRTDVLLEEHYEKHGKDMGYLSAEAYEKAAGDVVNNPASLHKIEAEDGDDVYYLESTNEFVVVAKDGFIRTYFYPEDGIDYYNRQ